MASNSGKEPTSSFYNIDSVPDDVWLFLFEYLTTSDLSSVSKASKKFYALTQRPLLRELTWAKATGTLRNVQDWADGAVLEPFRGVVRKVNVKLSYKKVNQHSALLLPVDWELYDSVHHRLLSFSNLRSLDLCGTIITPALYPVLEAIPSLRELSVIRCTFIWTYMYSPLLTNLGRQAPNPGLFVYNSANRSLSHQHGLIRAPSDPVQRAAQQTWLIENTVFDFTTRLSHITSLNLQCNRFTSHSSETDDLPYPPSEISRPCILHPLYLLSIPSLTHLTLTWTPTLAQVYDTLKQRFNFSGGQNGVGGGGVMGNNNPNVGAPGGVNAQAQHQFATLLFAANTFGVNLFTPLIVTLGQLTHATIIIEDLSRDMMESISALFEQRIRNVTQGLAPLRIHLKVGKHTLTEQNMGSSHFRLPGVYKYEGPLPIAGLLANEGAADMEEVVMNEAMEMTSFLTTLARLPRTLKKLDIRMFCWDREILYAVHSLFKGLNELVVRYGREELEENTYVVLGSDILPGLKSLHTIKLIPSIECIKRDTQFRYPYPGAGGHFHHFHGNHWWQQGQHHGGGGGAGGGPGHGGGFSQGAFGAGTGVGLTSIGGGLVGGAGAGGVSTQGSSTPQDYGSAQTPMDPIDINDYDLYDFGDEDLYYAISRIPPAHTAASPTLGGPPGAGSSGSSGVMAGSSGGGATPNSGSGGGGASASGTMDTSMDQDDDASSTSSETSAPPSPAVTPNGAPGTMMTDTTQYPVSGGGVGPGSGGNVGSAPSFPNRFTNFLLSPRRLSRASPQQMLLSGGSSTTHASGGVLGNSGAGASWPGSGDASTSASMSMAPPPTMTTLGSGTARQYTAGGGGRHGGRGTGRSFNFLCPSTITPSGPLGSSVMPMSVSTSTVPATPPPSSSSASSPSSSSSSSNSSLGSSGVSSSGSDQTGLTSSMSIISNTSSSSHSSSSLNTAFSSGTGNTSTTVLTERQRIALSLQEDLEDYLVGWNRHCPSLRVVQMESGWFWMRRFGGDPWRKMKASD